MPLQHVLQTQGFHPHGYCYLWRPELIWLHAISDALIGLAYVAIGVALVKFVRHARGQLPFSRMFIAFGVFIAACGATHFIEIWTLWTPVYWLAGGVKLLTAVASVYTAIALPALIPPALASLVTIRSSEQRRQELEESSRREAEAAAEARLNLRRLEAVLDALPVAVFITDMTGKVEIANPAAARIWGGQTPLVGGIESYTEYRAWHPSTRRPVQAEEWPIARAIRTGETIAEEELDIRAFDGTERTVLVSGSLIRSAQGEVLGGIAVNWDITERRRAEDALREQAALLDLAADAILVKDANERITYWNVGAEEQYGWSAEEAVGRRADELLTPRFLAGEAQVAESLTETGRWSGELVHRRRDGQEIIVAGRWARQVTGRGDGPVTLEINTDITSQKRAQEELLASRRQFRAAFEDAPIGMALVSLEGGWIDVNRALCQIVGYSEAELRDLTFQDITHPDDLEMDLEKVNQLLTGEIPSYELQKRYIHRDGHFVPILLTGSLVRDQDEQPLYFIGQIQDITERIRAEEELTRSAAELARSNRELEDFAYVASHDLQEPLRKIQAFGDTLAEEYRERLDETALDYLDRMQKAATRMRSLIEALLTYSRVSTRAEPPRRVSLDGVLRGVLSDLETRISETGAELRVAAMPTITADPLQMRQLFQNLIGNALKFRRAEGVPVVEVHAEVRGDVAEIRVADNGIGFDQDHAGRIFEPFERLHARSEYPGTGIGLAICRRIVERHGGSIEARSETGVGTEFLIRLPVPQGNASAAPEEQA